MQTQRLTRRGFSIASLLTGAGVWSGLAAAGPRDANETLNLGVIGAGGRGADNLAGTAGQNIAAICDVDAQPLDQTAARYPKARRYRDFRKLLDADDLDAVIIPSPDHTHALAAIGAMRRGLHVYCEKPLAHNLAETELMMRVAGESKVATQMGVQHHASDGYHRAVQILRAGVLGKVSEVHAWTVRPVWPQGIVRPRETPRDPRGLDWDLWLGPAPERPYHSAYHPRDWRGWFDFGTGAMGDFLPHLFDPVYEGLQLTAPAHITAESSKQGGETFPKWSIVRFDFPARQIDDAKLPGVRVLWYDGGKQPPADVAGVRRLPGNGALVVGERGKLFIPSHGKQPVVMAADKNERLELPDPLPPNEQTHWQEWIAACESGKPTSADFAYGAALTEVALLGNLAIRTGEPLAWDAANRRVANNDKANALITRDYRKGWELPKS